MRSLLIALTTSFALTSAANGDKITQEQVIRAANEFGIYEAKNLEGKDHKNRKCEIYLLIDSDRLSISAHTFMTEDGVEYANFNAATNYDDKVLELKVKGDARTNGEFYVKTREHQATHNTDFGWWVPAYDIDSRMKLTYKNGKIASADVKVDRPGLSNAVFDPDYRGGEIKKCQFN